MRAYAFRRGECTRRDESNTVIPSCPDMGVFEDLTERIVSVKSGSAAVLTLPPIESHPAPDVTWFTSDGSLLYGIKYASVHHTLLILNASEGDQGLYRFVFHLWNFCSKPQLRATRQFKSLCTCLCNGGFHLIFNWYMIIEESLQERSAEHQILKKDERKLAFKFANIW